MLNIFLKWSTDIVCTNSPPPPPHPLFCWRVKFAEYTDSHLFGEELEDSLKKTKGRQYSLQALKPKPPTHASTKRKLKP